MLETMPVHVSSAQHVQQPRLRLRARTHMCLSCPECCTCPPVRVQPRSQVRFQHRSGRSGRHDPLLACSIVVFGRDSCPFCTELERTLNDRATSGHAGAAGGKSPAAWSYYRLNRLENGGALHDALKAGTGQTSVPYLFVDGELVGGADDLATAAYDGSRPGLLGGGAVAADVDAPRWCAAARPARRRNARAAHRGGVC